MQMQMMMIGIIGGVKEVMMAKTRGEGIIGAVGKGLRITITTVIDRDLGYRRRWRSSMIMKLIDLGRRIDLIVLRLLRLIILLLLIQRCH